MGESKQQTRDQEHKSKEFKINKYINWRNFGVLKRGKIRHGQRLCDLWVLNSFVFICWNMIFWFSHLCHFGNYFVFFSLIFSEVINRIEINSDSCLKWRKPECSWESPSATRNIWFGLHKPLICQKYWFLMSHIRIDMHPLYK